MSRSRNIKPGFFKNEELAECSPLARLCFIGLWTLADREGRLEDRPKRWDAELFPFEDVDMGSLIDELIEHHFIFRYAVDGKRFVQVAEFSKHQNPHHGEGASTIPSPESVGLHHHMNGGWMHPGAADEHHDGGQTAPHRPQNGAEVESVEAQKSRQGGDKKSPPAVLIPDSGFLIPDSQEPSVLVSPRLSDESTRQHLDDDPPAPNTKTNGNGKAKVPECPHAELLALWAEVLPDMPQHDPKRWRGDRMQHLEARWREAATANHWPDQPTGLAYFREVFAYIGKSPYLTGRKHARGARAQYVELEWLVTAGNWDRTLEGKYHEPAAP